MTETNILVQIYHLMGGGGDDGIGGGGLAGVGSWVAGWAFIP